MAYLCEKINLMAYGLIAFAQQQGVWMQGPLLL